MKTARCWGESVASSIRGEERCHSAAQRSFLQKREPVTYVADGLLIGSTLK